MSPPRAALAGALLSAALGVQAQAERELEVVDGALPAAQRQITVRQGDALQWRIRSNLPGEVHVHAYRVRVAVQPGQVATLAFQAHATGRFHVEWHGAGSKPGDHHAPPLALLDVRPR